MGFTLIKGTFIPSAGVPDGDSVRFAADDIALWDQLQGRVNGLGRFDTLQLRFEGIDTLEKSALQPDADRARDNMLRLIGVTPAVENPRGYVMSKRTDGHGRPIVFVFAGDAPEDDGDDVFLTAERLEESVNFRQAADGFAYPLYYNTLFRDLREKLTGAVTEARSAGLRNWAADATMTGVRVTSRNDLKHIPPVWPKLWRRLEEYFRNHPDLSGFLQSVRNTGERADLMPSFEQHTMDNFMDVVGDTVRMTVAPERLRVITRI